MKLISQSSYEEKKSKFHARLYALDELDDYKKILASQKKEFKKANHHCFALCINNTVKISNDGEVGEPARSILSHLKYQNLNSHIIVVSRIFGGVKLGVGGVSRAFRQSLKNL